MSVQKRLNTSCPSRSASLFDPLCRSQTSTIHTCSSVLLNHLWNVSMFRPPAVESEPEDGGSEESGLETEESAAGAGAAERGEDLSKDGPRRDRKASELACFSQWG